MAITYSALTDMPDEVLVGAFNRGYEGYVVPIQLNESQLRGHIVQNDIDLASSRGAFDDGEAVGIALMGRRDSTAWIGGIGIAQGYRGQGIGRQLMLEVIEAGRASGIRNVQLEVIQGNERAYQLYLSLGFVVTRHLLILDRTAAPVESAPSIEVEAVPVEDTLAYYERFHPTPNPWQRQLPSLRYNALNLAARVAKRDGAITAYAAGFVSERGISLTDVAAAPGETDSLRAVVARLHQEQPGAVGRLVNLSEDDPALQVLSSLGYSETMRQYEMVKPI